MDRRANSCIARSSSVTGENGAGGDVGTAAGVFWSDAGGELELRLEITTATSAMRTAPAPSNRASGETPAGQTPTGATVSGSGGPGSATRTASATAGSGDSGGLSAAVWVLLGLGGAAVAGGAGWAAWRARHANR